MIDEIDFPDDLNEDETDESVTSLAYFVAGYVDSDSLVIIETFPYSEAYNQCMDNNGMGSFNVIAGPLPSLDIAQRVAPNATVISTLIDPPLKAMKIIGIADKIPVGIFVIGIIIIALTHGKVGKK